MSSYLSLQFKYMIFHIFTCISHHLRVVKEMDISQFEVPDFFSELTFLMNSTFKTWGKSPQLPYANEAKF